MTFSRRAIARSVLGIGVSVVAIWLLLRSVDLAAAGQVMKTASQARIAVMFVTCFVDIDSRGGSWRVRPQLSAKSPGILRAYRPEEAASLRSISQG